MFEEFKDRFQYAIDERGLTKSKVAERLEVSAAFISQICSGVRMPADRTISAFCRLTGCNERWLKFNDGDPFESPTRNEMITAFAADTVNGSDDFRKAFVAMLAKLDADDWKALAEIFQKVTAKEQ